MVTNNKQMNGVNMHHFQGLQINKIQSANSKDKRGVTYEWCKGKPGLQVTIYQRMKNSSFANHYHKGDDPAKNPERFFLIQGKVRLKAQNRLGQTLDEIISEGYEILISPGVYHSFEAVTDVIFIEYRSTAFDKNKTDSYPLDEYLTFVDPQKKNRN